jgi:hypothetical protein
MARLGVIAVSSSYQPNCSIRIARTGMDIVISALIVENDSAAQLRNFPRTVKKR